MKKKVKKFGAGGDIVTALGVGLIGKALYDKYKEGTGKDDEESDYAKKVREFRGSKKDTTETAPEPAKKEEDKPMSREEYLEKRGAKPIKETGTFKGPDTAEPDLEYKGKKATAKKAAPAAKPTKVEPAAKPTKDKPRAKAADNASPKSVVFKDATTSASKTSAAAEAPAKIGSQGSFKFDSQPDLSVPKAFDMKSGNKTVYGTDTTSVFQKQAARARAEAEEKAAKEREAAEAAKRRKGASEIKYDEMGNPMRKGGAVKKYASGGTVKSSASRRADGIAQRGKTRGRIY